MFSVKHNNVLLLNLLATSFGHETIITPSLYCVSPYDMKLMRTACNLFL